MKKNIFEKKSEFKCDHQYIYIYEYKLRKTTNLA